MKTDYDSKIIQQHLFWIQVCSRQTEEDMIKTINNIKPCAETGKWVKAPDFLMQDPNPNTCDESNEHMHYILVLDGVYTDESSKPESRNESSTLSGLPEIDEG